MRSLKFYPDDTFEFHQNVLSAKQDNDYRNRISGHDNTVKDLFKHYDENFKEAKLEKMNPHSGFGDETIKDFQKLYSYRAKIFQVLKVRITTVENNRVMNTCQNCTINEVNSFDHFLPREEFPEFIVNPKNLFPSCTQCNGYKNTAWRDGYKGVFLNLYLDTLPKAQYLFVDLNVSPTPNGMIETHFDIRNQSNMNEDFFAKLKSHYDRLHLCRRFSTNNDSVITELINNFSATVNKEEKIAETIRVSNLNKESFGHNHWKDILRIALVNDANFLARFP